jgi:mannose/cellobiose epimerase-like protein (N-acyl-D-glucosamine 2-epimerase family)
MNAVLREEDGTQAVQAVNARLMSWLLKVAYPTWSLRGIDLARGGFQERLTLTGEPTDDARRARVQARQIFAFAMAPRLGWKGDANGAVAQGLSYFLTRYRRPDGLYRTLVAADGTPVNERAVLYDQAFALLGFAAAAPLLGGCFDLAGEAAHLRATLYKSFKHPRGGFETDLSHALPLLSNPHMRLLEAALAWLDVGDGADWQALADEMGQLVLSRIIDPKTGIAHEAFDESWRPTADVAGRLIQPGHQFEWAWLLMRWGQRRADAREAALRLIDNAEKQGIHGGVAIQAVTDDGFVQDGSARLWAQAARLKAASLAARLHGDTRYWRIASGAAVSMLQYLDTQFQGLWYDRLRPSGEFVPETVMAGNLYHIVGAMQELAALVRSAGR